MAAADFRAFRSAPTRIIRAMKALLPKIALGIVALTMAAAAPLLLAADATPSFEIDASWPKPLPKNWILGQIGGIFVDKDDNVWISQRPRSVNDRDKRAERGDKSVCCYTAPSVIAFNQAGDVVKSWGVKSLGRGKFCVGLADGGLPCARACGGAGWGVFFGLWCCNCVKLG